MPKTTISEEQASLPFIVTHTPVVIVIVAVALVGIFGNLWFTRIYNSPKRVFDAMLRNNFSTSSVTRSSSTVGQEGLERVEQLSFVPPVASRTYITLSQPSEAGTTTVESETIGTRNADYSQYLRINVAGNQQGNKYAAVQNVWSRSSVADGQPQYLAQATQGLIPFGNLNASQRDQIVRLINDKKVFTVNYASTKPQKVGKKSALNFSVAVNTSAYVEMLKVLNKMTGTGDVLDLNAEDYKDQPPVTINVVVDKLTRQVLEATYGQQKEVYSAYGLAQAVDVPEKTIPFSELQQRIQTVQ